MKIAGFSFAWKSVAMDRKTFVDEDSGKSKWIYSQKIYETYDEAVNASREWSYKNYIDGQNLVSVILSIPFEDSTENIKVSQDCSNSMIEWPKWQTNFSKTNELINRTEEATAKGKTEVIGPYGDKWINKGTSIKPNWVHEAALGTAYRITNVGTQKEPIWKSVPIFDHGE